jgi:hypothetical protein
MSNQATRRVRNLFIYAAPLFSRPRLSKKLSEKGGLAEDAPPEKLAW